MANFNPSIFRAYDVRGIWRTDFDALFAQNLGGKVATYLKAEKLVVGRDERSSSDELAYAVMDGAVHAGCQVVDVGSLSSPQFYWAIRDLKAAGGIMVTASHNPQEDNGFKVIGQEGQILGGDHLRQIYDSQPYAFKPGGGVTYQDILAQYTAAIAQAAKWDGQALAVALDAPLVVRRVLELLGPIAPDPRLGAKFDLDGDRIVFYWLGQAVSADWIFLLLAEKLDWQPLVFDLRFSRLVHERLRAQAKPFSVSRVGRLYLHEAMQKNRAAFGAETSGHYYFKQFGGMEAPELVLLRVAQILNQTGASLPDLIKPYQKYYKSPEISFPVKDSKTGLALLRHLQDKYASHHIDHTDGLTVEAWDTEGFWFNVRPSNTESLLRLVVEAKTDALLVKKLRELTGVLH